MMALVLAATLARPVTVESLRPGWWQLGPRDRLVIVRVEDTRPDAFVTFARERATRARLFVYQLPGGVVVIWDASQRGCWRITRRLPGGRVRGIYEARCDSGDGVPFRGRKRHFRPRA